MTRQEPESAVLGLLPAERADLAFKLVVSLKVLTDAENEALWVEEATRRDNELIEGKASERPAAHVLRDIRGRL